MERREGDKRLRETEEQRKGRGRERGREKRERREGERERESERVSLFSLLLFSPFSLFLCLSLFSPSLFVFSPSL